MKIISTLAVALFTFNGAMASDYLVKRGDRLTIVIMSPMEQEDNNFINYTHDSPGGSLRYVQSHCSTSLHLNYIRSLRKRGLLTTEKTAMGSSYDELTDELRLVSIKDVPVTSKASVTMKFAEDINEKDPTHIVDIYCELGVSSLWDSISLDNIINNLGQDYHLETHLQRPRSSSSKRP